jgi:hypothetical protein
MPAFVSLFCAAPLSARRTTPSMNDPRRSNKSNPTTRVAVLIIVIVLIGIATFLFNAIKGKREYDEQNAAAASSSAAASASGASQ